MKDSTGVGKVLTKEKVSWVRKGIGRFKHKGFKLIIGEQNFKKRTRINIQKTLPPIFL
jgi:hypothetical protein